MSGDRQMRIVDPSTGSLLATVTASSAAEVDAAAERARVVHRSGTWSGLDPRERGETLLRLAAAMERDAELLARLDSEDGGKPVTDCITGDVPGAIEAIRWFSEAADKVYGRVAPTGRGALGFTTREPFGVVAAITPWNYPLAMAAWKIGPALAAGNCLLLKPAEATPRSALHVQEVAAEVGVPEGVLTVLPGHGDVAGAALSASPVVGALSFTGSTATGRRILESAARSNFKRVSLEMGGKSPQVLLDDALRYDDELFDDMVVAAFLSSGQNCTAGSRVLVHRSIAAAVVDRFVAAAEALRVGSPADPATQMGPLIDGAAYERVAAAVDEARAGGGTVLTGGHRLDSAPGAYFYAPTVVADPPLDADVWAAEVFGPVVAIRTFDTVDEAVDLANETSYGLAASLWTADLDRALDVSRRLEAGVVSVNSYSEGDITMPFGGWKQSGFGGTEKSLSAFDQWTREKMTWIHTR